MSCLMTVAQLDRQILSLQLDQIGQEFALSDTQLGLLSGFAFAVVFVLCGFPVARLAATGSRRGLIAVAAAVWSLFTIVTAMAQGFGHLLLARIGVAAGESGSIAPAHSVISDRFSEERRSSAMAAFAAGANLGVLLAFLIGGVVGQIYGWRMAFVCAGLPGLGLALVFWRYGPRDTPGVEVSSTPVLIFETWTTLRAHAGLWHAMWGMAATGIATFGSLSWTPTIILRNHDLNQAQVGVFLAVTAGIIGGLGTFFSGRLADRLGRQRPWLRIGVVLGAILLAKPMVMVFLLAADRAVALTALVGSTSLAAAFWGPTFAYAHAQVPSHMRPMVTAMFLFLFNLVGLGLGPTLVGVVSDLLAERGVARPLAGSLIGVHLLGLWGAWHYWRVIRFIRARGYAVPLSAPPSAALNLPGR
ncbi:MFS transporter [Phaeobacter sp. QD34_3]|uniref:MFS transporter n=1 Tax=unclassified Phaeobacter TaxID=2621772 RepID=UPI00237F502F|nr:MULTISPECIES: MFS transporter [unclassified Phaeobacter]MDE4133494.1 MFS transporter [Phaeobacter sp. QD34_3]MDE4137130.1 MFS transporter [Phaeobacter sp. QD34_24]